MKSYKLIKSYPSLPKYIEVGSCVKFEFMFNKYISSSKKTFRREEIENHPEFWEEVKELKNKEDTCIVLSTKTLPWVRYDIRSLERVSDKVNFKIGDNTNAGIIINFKRVGNEFIALFRTPLCNYCINVSKLEIKLEFFNQITKHPRKLERFIDGEIFSTGDNTNHGVIKYFRILDGDYFAFCGEPFTNDPISVSKLKKPRKQLQYKVTSTTYLTAASPEPSIKSITRLSDNRSFQIRDRVNGGVIKEFVLDEKYEGGLKIIISDTRNCSLNYLYMELPICKSEDGVDMYNGDPVWKIKEDGSIKCFKMQSSIGHISTYPLLFSTIEAAMDYKRANKKSISLNNVLSFCDEIGINKYLAYDYFKQY